MADRSAIEWTEATWNPVTGCTKVSPGCAHCYAETISLRFGRSKHPWTPEHEAENVVLHPDRLEHPLRWRRPRMIFVNSMSDLFHELVPFHFISEVVDVMARAEQHTFQVLTKRPERIFEWLDAEASGEGWYAFPENVWVGVSVENARHTHRADWLRAVPCYTRFISAEPLLGSLFAEVGDSPVLEFEWDCNGESETYTTQIRTRGGPLGLAGIDWLIVGGESGPKHRPMNIAWARELRDACVSADVAFFYKQLGGRTPKAGGRELDGREWNQMPVAA